MTENFIVKGAPYFTFVAFLLALFAVILAVVDHMKGERRWAFTKSQCNPLKETNI